MLLCLLLLLTGCASNSAVSKPVVCQHPLVNLQSNGGMAEAVLLYYETVELCNALNAVAPSKDSTKESNKETKHNQEGK